MEDIKVKAGQQIKAARIAKGLTQQELGDLVGVNRAAISKYEAGQLTLETIIKVASTLKLEVQLNLI